MSLNVESTDGLDKVVVKSSTMDTLHLRGQLGKTQSDFGGIQYRLLAAVALDASLTARQGGEQVVAVHGSDLVVVSVPQSGTVAAADPIYAHQTF